MFLRLLPSSSRAFRRLLATQHGASIIPGSIRCLSSHRELYRTLKASWLHRPRQYGHTSLTPSPSPFRVPARSLSTPAPKQPEKEEGEEEVKKPLQALRENIYTIPNALTLSRIISCPFLAWSILEGNFAVATGILAYAGISDSIDGWLARRYNMGSVLGTILDPAADKALMTTLTVTLAMKGLLPVPLAVIILGRDVLLSLAAFVIRYKTLPAPKTFSRYWDFSIPSAEVHPTGISKANTALQLLLMGMTTIGPVVSIDLDLALQALQWIVAGTTISSGLSYVFSSSAVRVVSSKGTSLLKK